MTKRPNIERLLRPHSVAVIGASAEPFSLGNNVMTNLSAFGYGGEILPVSRRFDQVEGIVCIRSVGDLPEAVDLAALVVPAGAVRETISECAARGIGSAVIFASGFAELGVAGAAEQAEISSIARSAGMAVLGPNCLGFTNFVAGVPVTFERVQPFALAGPGVAIVAQSGAMTGNIREALRSRGLPVAYAISTGNEAVLSAEEVLGALVDDPAVATFTAFVEQIRDPAAFLDFARSAWRLGKPVVLMHPGRSQRSREAAQSHTGAMAGDHMVMEAFVRAAGVSLAASFDELFDTTLLRHRYPSARIGGLGVVTNSGAVRGFCLDFCEEIGLALPALQAATTGELSTVLPDFATIDNPLDITAMGMSKPSLFGDSCAALLGDGSIDALLVAAMGGAPKQVLAKWQSLKPVVTASEKPVAIAFLGDELPMPDDFLAEIRTAGVPFFRSPERAMRAFAGIARLGEARHLPAVAALSPGVPRTIAEYQGKQRLKRAGFDIPQGGLAKEADEAVRLAAHIGYPVALKVQSDVIAHKSDVGGVRLGITSEADLREAFAAVASAVAGRAGEVAIDGMLLEEMAPRPELELVVSARRDAAWGAVLVVGLGGVFTELLKDFALVPAGSPKSDLEAALRSLKGARLFEGFRGTGALDIEAVVDLLERLGRLIAENGEIAEVELNPVAVYPRGGGVRVLDVLMTVMSTTPA
jgi:acetate---CoA ligase (ADP-forming)